MIIKLNTIEDVNYFVSICSHYEVDIDVRQDHHIVDGKSILGIFSLNLLEPVKVIIDSEDDNSKIDFYKDIERWKVDKDNELPVSSA